MRVTHLLYYILIFIMLKACSDLLLISNIILTYLFQIIRTYRTENLFSLKSITNPQTRHFQTYDLKREECFLLQPYSKLFKC